MPTPQDRQRWKNLGLCGNCGRELDAVSKEKKYIDCQHCRDAYKAWRIKRVKANLCYCGRELTSDKARCDICLSKLRQKRPSTAKQHFCQKCKEPRESGQTKYCKKCAAKVKASRIRKRRKEEKKNKRCIYCSKLLYGTGKVKICPLCWEIRNEILFDHNICINCKKPKKKSDKNFKMCKKCRDIRALRRRIREAKRSKQKTGRARIHKSYIKKAESWKTKQERRDPVEQKKLYALRKELENIGGNIKRRPRMTGS